MHKSIEIILCDSCHRNLTYKPFLYKKYELCHECVQLRLELSEKVIPIGEKCSGCGGGKYIDLYGYKKCPKCNTSGLEPLKEKNDE